MSEKPILFSGPMIRALLDGRKTQTRRVVKPQPTVERGMLWLKDGMERVAVGVDAAKKQLMGMAGFCCPHGQAGSLLWVKETWATIPGYNVLRPRQLSRDIEIIYRAGHPDDKWRWRPSIFMPRWASRLMLRIESVRVERLQEMTFDDWVADFCPSYVEQEKARQTFHGWDNQRTMAEAFWDSINGKRCPWESNPWVWVISFLRVRRPSSAGAAGKTGDQA